MNQWQIKDEEQFSKDCKAVVLGDEGCIHKVLHKKWLDILKRAVSEKSQVRFLTPMVPDKYCKELYEYLLQMASITKLKVTFNDYGFLYMCKSLIEEGKIVPVLGRVLTRSILDCRWHDRLLDGEDEELVREFQKHSFLHKDKLELLKELHVNEIELNLEAHDSVKELKKHGLRCVCYGSNSMVSMGRICYAARWHKITVPECTNSEKCYQKLHFELAEQWGNERLMYEEATPEMKQYFSNCYIEGNVVYRTIEQDEKDTRLDDFDEIIF